MFLDQALLEYVVYPVPHRPLVVDDGDAVPLSF